jgi:hypothetical protein
MSDLERKTAEELVYSLTHNPTAWSWFDSDCDMLRGPNGITMSAAFMRIYRPVKVRFGFWNTRRIRRAFNVWKRTAGRELKSKEHERALIALRRCLTELRAVA